MDELKLKIAKLLKKAESTDSPAEAEALTEAAERLMLKWGIEAAELEAVGQIKPESIVEKEKLYTGSYAGEWITFGSYIANGFGLRTLQWKIPRQVAGGNAIKLYVVGHETDVEHCFLLLESLEKQVMSALKVFQYTDYVYMSLDRQEKHRATKQFYRSFAFAVNRRLKAIYSEEKAQASSGAELVLVSKEQRVNDFYNNVYGHLKPAANRERKGAVWGAQAGQEAGNAASLAGGTIGSNHKAVSQ